MDAPTPQPEPETPEASDTPTTDVRTDPDLPGRVTELGPDAQRRTMVAPEAQQRATR